MAAVSDILEMHFQNLPHSNTDTLLANPTNIPPYRCPIN